MGPAASPDSGTSDNDLYGVTCASSTECWAVGDYWGSDDGPHILILGLVGGSWTTTVGGYTETESAAGYLYGVACATAGECWAVGRAADGDGYDQVVAEGWAGSSWTSVTAPDSSSPCSAPCSSAPRWRGAASRGRPDQGTGRASTSDPRPLFGVIPRVVGGWLA